MRSWFERDPELLARELNALAELGAEVSIDEEARAAGALRLHITYPGPSGPIQLIGQYPDLFPYFRPEVFAPDLDLPRHQHPMSKALCLIGRRTSRWFAEDSLATLLEQQFPRLLPMVAGEGIETVLPFEEPQGEPISEYYNSESPRESLLLFDGRWSIPADVEDGTFTAKVRRVDREGPPELTVHGYIKEVRASSGQVLARWDGPAFDGVDETISGRWTRVAEVPPGNINVLLPALGEKREWLMNEAAWSHKQHLSVGLLLVSEEVSHQQFADGWIAVQWLGSRRQKGQAQRRIIGTFLRTARAGEEDLAARMPATKALQDRSVILFGAGAIGAPVAVELARAGIGKLLIVDPDTVDPATVRRWPFGASAFGALKVDVLRERLAVDYPWTEVLTDTMKVGATEDESFEARQGERLEQLLAGRDLIIDCTAELGVNHFLSELARVRGVHYILANATPGAWGGMVASFDGQGSCWLCLRQALYGEQSLPLPPADPAGELQPPGCADPTFTGSSFDLAEVSLEAVRTAAGLLSGDEGYPRSDWQFAALRLRSDEGRRIPPVWESRLISPRENCACRHS